MALKDDSEPTKIEMSDEPIELNGRKPERTWTRSLIPESTFNAIDLATFAYLAITGLFIILFSSNLDQPSYHLGMRLVMTVVIYSLIRLCDGHRGLIKVLRYWYPAFLFPYFYTETASLNHMVFQGYWDPWLEAVDLAMFGQNPNLWLYDQLNRPWFNEVIHFCYFTYYFISTTLAVVLYVRKSLDFPRVFFVVSAGFYSCYLMYMFIPAVGPLHLRDGRFLDGSLFIPIMNWIYTHAEKPGAAFPSSHVAIAIMTLLFAHRSHRKTFWVFLPLVTGLVFSTVYCFYHYVIDIIVGFGMGLLFYAVYNRLYDKKFAEQFKSVFD